MQPFTALPSPEEHRHVILYSGIFPFHFHLRYHTTPLPIHIFPIIAPQSSQNPPALRLPPYLSKPPRALWKDPHGEKQHQERNDLKCDWKTPQERRSSGKKKRKRVGKPVCRTNAKDIKGKFLSDEGPASGRRRDFRSVNGYNSIENPSAETVEQTCTYHPFSVLGGGLEYGAYGCPEGAEGYAFYAAVGVADGAADEAAD